MEWWTDLWLNEGFASYVSAIGIDHIHPDWKIVSSLLENAPRHVRIRIKSVYQDSENTSRANQILLK